MLRRLLSLNLLSILLGVCPAYSLTVEEVLTLKKAGVSDSTVQMLIEQENKNLYRADRLGIYTTPGGWVIHSTGRSPGCPGFSASHTPNFVYPSVAFPFALRR